MCILNEYNGFWNRLIRKLGSWIPNLDVDEIEVLYAPWEDDMYGAWSPDMNWSRKADLVECQELDGRLHISERLEPIVFNWKNPIMRQNFIDLGIKIPTKDYMDWLLIKFNNNPLPNRFFYDMSELVSRMVTPISIKSTKDDSFSVIHDLNASASTSYSFSNKSNANEAGFVFRYITTESGYYLFLNERTKKAIVLLLDDRSESKYNVPQN